MFDSVRITTWLFIPFLLFLKVSSLKIKLFKNFQGCFTVQLSRFLSCFSVVSLPEQLWYHITAFSVCQQLFSTFLFSFFISDYIKRRKRDLNPRAALTRPTPLAGAPLQPLEYFSWIINLYEVDASQRMSYYTHNVLSCQLLFSFFLFLFVGAVLIPEVCIRLFLCLCGVFRSDVLHNTTTFLRCQHLFLKFFKFFVFYILYLFFIHFRLFLINFKSCESNRRTLYVTFWTEHMQKNAAASKVFLAFDATAPFSILSINMLSYRCWSAVIFQASRLIF